MTGPRIVLAKPGLDGHDQLHTANADVPLVVGGTIPPRDADTLRQMGVSAVFAVGTPLPAVLTGVLSLAGSAAAR